MYQLFYMEIFIDNIVYIVVFVTIVTLVFFFLNRSQRSVISNDNSSYNQIEIRLRAYERLILFLERIEPVSMINRLELHNQSIDFIKFYIKIFITISRFYLKDALRNHLDFSH